MAKHPQADQTLNKEDFKSEAGIVNFAEARVRLRLRLATNPSSAVLLGELGAVQLLLDQGHSTEAEFWLASLIKAARHDKQLMAQARCKLSVALEQQGRYGESLAAIETYEQPEARARLEVNVARALRIQLGLAYNYTGDFPKAIALLNAVLRETTRKRSRGRFISRWRVFTGALMSSPSHVISRRKRWRVTATRATGAV
jgi:tetratricopeptide (TPR) repeat protein